MLRVLQSQIDSYRAQIEKLFPQHPDHDLFGSLPGAGPKIAPRLLGEMGSDRSRFEDPSALQCLAGTAPVSYQSGQIHKVYLRRHCNKLLRHAVHMWANLSRKSCPKWNPLPIPHRAPTERPRPPDAGGRKYAARSGFTEALGQE
jgi:transposase